MTDEEMLMIEDGLQDIENWRLKSDEMRAKAEQAAKVAAQITATYYELLSSGSMLVDYVVAQRIISEKEEPTITPTKANRRLVDQERMYG